MKKLLVALAAAALAVAFMVAMSGTAVAKEGKPCPHDRNDAGAPNCGKGKGGGEPPPPVNTCTDGKDNDNDGETDGDDSECQDPDDGVEDGSDLPPAGVCDDERVALVLLRQLDPSLPVLICLYDEGISQEDLDADCPGALLALTQGEDGPGAICVLPTEPEEAALAVRGAL
jgi:hypothetical protein